MTKASAEEIAEDAACASLLASNNIFYRFRHFTKKEKYSQIPARIRMQIMMKPVTGKEFFELMSLVISAVNGCEMCVNSHEDSLIKLGTTEERIFDAVRIASIITATGKIFFNCHAGNQKLTTNNLGPSSPGRPLKLQATMFSPQYWRSHRRNHPKSHIISLAHSPISRYLCQIVKTDFK